MTFMQTTDWVWLIKELGILVVNHILKNINIWNCGVFQIKLSQLAVIISHIMCRTLQTNVATPCR